MQCYWVLFCSFGEEGFFKKKKTLGPFTSLSLKAESILTFIGKVTFVSKQRAGLFNLPVSI